MVSSAAQSEQASDQADEARVRAGFWPKIKGAAARIPFAEDILAAYYCAFDHKTPLPVRATLWGALAYFVVPFDGLPDYLPLIGFTDDAAALAAALKIVATNMQPDHREAARRMLDRLASQPE